jgi:phosphoesterase RecJ-like protein
VALRVLGAERILVATHLRPDGDALGSVLGLALGLEKLGKQVARLCEDAAPPNYRFLPLADRLSSHAPDWPEAPAVVVDADGLERTGGLAPTLARSPLLIDIDHHASQKAFGHLAWVEPAATATGELVYRLLRALMVPAEAEIATCLYCAILTDSGRFTFSNTRAAALHLAARLVRAGADPRAIAAQVYEEKSLAATRLLGRALSKASAELGGRAILVCLEPEDFQLTGALASETEGIIDHLRGITGAEVAVLLTVDGKGGVRASLRSRGRVDVSRIAAALGGGGHFAAAGCNLGRGLEPGRSRLLEKIEQALAAAK